MARLTNQVNVQHSGPRAPLDPTTTVYDNHITVFIQYIYSKQNTYHKGPVILCVVWAHCSSSFPSIVAWCRSCWWWIHIYYDLVKRITNKKEKKQTYQGGPNDVSFGPTARHLSPPSRHGVRGHGGGSYIYDLVKRINKQKKTYFRWVVWARLHCDQALFVVCGGGEYIYI